MVNERAYCATDRWDVETWAVLNASAMQIVLPMIVKHYRIIMEKEAVEWNRKSLGQPFRQDIGIIYETVESLNKATLVKIRATLPTSEVTSGSRWSHSAPITMIITKPGYITEKYWKSWLACCWRLQDLTWIALQAQFNSGKQCGTRSAFYHRKSMSKARLLTWLQINDMTFLKWLSRKSQRMWMGPEQPVRSRALNLG